MPRYRPVRLRTAVPFGPPLWISVMKSPCLSFKGVPLKSGFANATSEAVDTHMACGVSVADGRAEEAEPNTCGYHSTAAAPVPPVKSEGLFDAANRTVTPHRGGRIASRYNRCQTVWAEPPSIVNGALSSISPNPANEFSESGTNGYIAAPPAADAYHVGASNPCTKGPGFCSFSMYVSPAAESAAGESVRS